MAYGKKKYVKKVKKFHRRFRKLIKKNTKQGYFSTKFYGNVTLFNNTGGAIATSMSVHRNFPGWCRAPDGLVNLFGTYSNHLQKCFSMYDEYKVTLAKMELRHPNITAPIGTSVLSPVDNNNYPIIYTAIDNDSDQLLTNVATAMTTAGTRRHQIYTGRAIKVSAKQSKFDRKKWYNCSNFNPNSIPSTSNTLTEQMPKRGSLQFLLQRTQNTNLCIDVFATWYVQFRGLNSIQNPLTSDIVEDVTGASGPHTSNQTYNYVASITDPATVVGGFTGYSGNKYPIQF